MTSKGYKFFDRPDYFSFKAASIGTAIRAIRLELNFQLTKLMDGETLPLDEDLKRLREKLPEAFLDKFQDEFQDNYSTKFHSSHKTSISLFQMDDNGKFLSTLLERMNSIITHPLCICLDNDTRAMFSADFIHKYLQRGKFVVCFLSLSLYLNQKNSV